MQNLRQRVWNWLPTFLAVADAGSITDASKTLHLTTAAVSRTLRLLEGELGEQLFNRVGRTLVLNERGARLRESLSDASASVDRGIARTLSSAFAGPLRVASLGVLTDHFIIASLLDLKREYSALIPEHRNMGAAEAARDVASGMLDVAFYYEDLTVEGAQVEHVVDTSMSVYCGRGHPLFKSTKPSQADVLKHAFSVPQIGDAGRVLDGWPTELPRAIGMRITTLRSNLEVCRSGLLVCVLPDATAFESHRAGDLRRLDVIELPAIPIFAARDVSGLRGGAADALVDAVVDRVTEFNREFASSVAAVGLA